MMNMTVKAKAVYTLYRAKRIDIEGVRRAVAENVITAADFEVITGTAYVA